MHKKARIMSYIYPPNPAPERLHLFLNQCGKFTVETQENKELERARRAYEKARAVFYTNPSDPELKQQLAAKEGEVRSIRLRRQELETKMREISDFCRALQVWGKCGQ